MVIRLTDQSMNLEVPYCYIHPSLDSAYLLLFVSDIIADSGMVRLVWYYLASLPSRFDGNMTYVDEIHIHKNVSIKHHKTA